MKKDLFAIKTKQSYNKDFFKKIYQQYKSRENKYS